MVRGVSGQWSPFGELEAQRVTENTPTHAHISFTDLLSKAAIKKGSKSEINYYDQLLSRIDAVQIKLTEGY